MVSVLAAKGVLTSYKGKHTLVFVPYSQTTTPLIILLTPCVGFFPLPHQAVLCDTS